jgi:hypothetical protein
MFLLCAGAYLGILALSMAATGSTVTALRVSTPQLLAIAPGALAAVAAFASVVPGYSKRVIVWPLIGTIVWLGASIAGSFQEPKVGAILSAQHEWVCVAIIVLGGAPLMIAFTAMLRRGAPLNPRATAILAAFSVGTLASVAACVSRPHPGEGITLAWHGGAIIALVLGCAWAARLVLKWGADFERTRSRASTSM